MMRGDGADVEALVRQLLQSRHHASRRASARSSSGPDGTASDVHAPLVVCLDWDRTWCSTKNGADPLRGVHRLDPELLAVACDSSHGDSGADPGGDAARAATLLQVHVVTRNSHVESIREMLRRHGVGEQVRVHSVPKGSKGATLLKLLGYEDGDATNTQEHSAATAVDATAPSTTPHQSTQRVPSFADVSAVFVDDDIAEHCEVDARMQQSGCAHRVFRVLFSRALV
jgi:hypothetical protein